MKKVNLSVSARRRINRRAPDAILADSMFKNEALSAYEAGKDFFGRFGSGKGGVSACRREIYAEVVDAKRRLR